MNEIEKLLKLYEKGPILCLFFLVYSIVAELHTERPALDPSQNRKLTLIGGWRINS